MEGKNSKPCFSASSCTARLGFGAASISGDFLSSASKMSSQPIPKPSQLNQGFDRALLRHFMSSLVSSPAKPSCSLAPCKTIARIHYHKKHASLAVCKYLHISGISFNQHNLSSSSPSSGYSSMLQ